jgi:DNA polymerase-3 subunit delta
VRRAIDAGKIPPVWLWLGPETWLKDELFQRLLDGVVGEMGNLNASRHRLPSADLGEVLNTCRTLPMLSDRRVVLLDDVDRLQQTRQPDLLEYVGHPAPETVLVLASNRFKGDALHRDLIRAGAAPATFWTPRPDQSVQWIRIRFRDLGKKCDPETARELYRRCGGGAGEGEAVSLKAVAPEIEKVALHVGEREGIREEDLGVIARKAEEGLLREITACVSRRDLPGALRALDGALLFRDNTEVRVVATLSYRLLDLLRARGMVEDGIPPGEAVRKMGVWQKVRPEYESGLRRYDGATLERGLAVLAAADRALKSSPKQPRLILEDVLISICSS